MGGRAARRDIPTTTEPPDDAREDERPEVFRPRLWLRSVVVGACAFWIFVFFLLVALNASAGRAFLSVGFFIALFTVLGVFYNNVAIEVRRDDVIVRGISSFRLVAFRDILKVEVKPGLLQTTYAVLARNGFVSFTNLFAGHERLMELIVERSRLGRL